MTPRTAPAASRMSADDRRELVLDAATRAFARGGYAGTSTDAVAKEAGVSQPYVVRIFGTKLDLFLEVFTHATGRIAAAFAGRARRAAVRPGRRRRLGAARRRRTPSCWPTATSCW